jgi:hypothetical protein
MSKSWHLRLVSDIFGHQIRLTAERLAHVLEHPEMAGLEPEILKVLRQPQLVCRSTSDSTVRLFYDFYPKTVLGGKWLCVVVNIAATMRLWSRLI